MSEPSISARFNAACRYMAMRVEQARNMQQPDLGRNRRAHTDRCGQLDIFAMKF